MTPSPGDGQRRSSSRPTARRLSLSVLAVTLATLALVATPLSSLAAPFGSRVILAPSTQTAALGATASLTATVSTFFGGRQVGVTVTFVVSGAHSTSGSAVTDASGNAVFTYREYTAGTDSVVASWSGVSSNTATVTWGTTGTYTLTLAPSSTSATVNTAVAFTATAAIGGVPQPNVLVNFTVTGANGQSGSAYTDSSGVAQFSYTGTNTGTDTVYAAASSYPTDSSTVSWSSTSSSANSVTISPSSLDALTGTAQSFTATVEDVNGNPIVGALVTFSVTGANSRSGSATTNASGQAAFTYTGTNAGADTLTATSLGVSGTAGVTWLTGPLSITLAASSTSLSPGTSVTVTATVRDGSSNLVNGVTVHFVVTGANATSGNIATNTSGQAGFAYTGTNAGTDTVTAFPDLNNNGAQDTGEPSATATIAWVGQPSLSLVASSTSPAVGSPVTVTATLANPGTAVNNVVVHFAVTGANPQSGTAVTNASGQATLTYTGANTGTDTVSAYADLNNNSAQDTGEPSASVSVTWVAAAPTAFAPAQPTTAKAGCTYFAITGHNLCAGFQAYWNKFGGLAIYGYPLTEEFVENGVTVQYFERARFEWHPGTDPSHFDVLLGLVGDEVTAGRATQAPFVPTAAKAGCTYFAATGHNLCAGFAAYWNQFGGLATFGMPISEEFQETNPDTGQVYTVQYFERARFEWHPGAWPARFDVELGRLGAQVLAMRYHTMY